MNPKDGVIARIARENPAAPTAARDDFEREQAKRIRRRVLSSAPVIRQRRRATRLVMLCILTAAACIGVVAAIGVTSFGTHPPAAKGGGPQAILIPGPGLGEPKVAPLRPRRLDTLTTPRRAHPAARAGGGIGSPAAVRMPTSTATGPPPLTLQSTAPPLYTRTSPPTLASSHTATKVVGTGAASAGPRITGPPAGASTTSGTYAIAGPALPNTTPTHTTRSR